LIPTANIYDNLADQNGPPPWESAVKNVSVQAPSGGGVSWNLPVWFDANEPEEPAVQT